MSFTSPLAEALAPHVLERFQRYVRIDTQSSPATGAEPSTPGQLDLGRLLVEELREIGLEDAAMDEGGFVFATLSGEGPVVGLLAHVDTTPEVVGAGVEPIVHRSYDGGVIELPRGGTVLEPAAMPVLAGKAGHDIVTASGDTLLGADDKAGVAEIMTAVAHLAAHPELPRPTLRVGFTPDEEIGLGATRFDLERFGATCAYTLDGSQPGELQDETFSAVGITVTFRGVDVHPGWATGKLVNATRLAARFLAALPPELTPEATQGREGFVHAYEADATTARAVIKLIARDFDDELLQQHVELVRRVAGAGGARRRGRGQASVLEHAPPPGGRPRRRRARRAGDPRRGPRGRPRADPRRHRRLDPQRPRAADAQPVHGRPRVPLEARVGVGAGHGVGRCGRRPARRGLGVLAAGRGVLTARRHRAAA